MSLPAPASPASTPLPASRFTAGASPADAPLPTPQDKAARHELARREIEALLDGLEDPVAAMASAATVLYDRLTWASWVGFYRVVAPELLRVGPYQGPVGCLDIPFDRGVCGAAARLAAPQVVPDVHAFPGHIACDAATRSEIVVPVFDPEGELVAVLDLDSHQPDAFDDTDRQALEAVAERVGRTFG